MKTVECYDGRHRLFFLLAVLLAWFGRDGVR